MEYKIEKNIPLPLAKSERGRGKRVSKYPYSKMNVGESFVICNTYTPRKMTSACGTAASFAKNQNPPWKFAARKTKDNQIRIWRIE